MNDSGSEEDVEEISDPLPGRSVAAHADTNNGTLVALNTGKVATTINHNHTTADELVGLYLRGLQVDPKDLRTNAVRSISDTIIDECWEWILAHPTFEKWLKEESAQLLWIHEYNDKSGGREKVGALIEQCGHFLRIQGGKIYLLHKLAKDFLMRNDGSTAYFSTTSGRLEHARVARRCLVALHSTLENRDFSNIDSLINRELSKVIQRLNGIEYACYYWFKHVIEAGEQFTDEALVRDFFQERYLPWLEGMGHLESIPHCIQILQALRTASLRHWTGLEHTKSNIDNSPIQDLIYDSFRFLLQHQAIIKEDPTQVYFLAMFFTPKNSQTRQNCRKRVSSCLKVVNEAQDDWGSCLYSIDGCNYNWGDENKYKSTSGQAHSLSFSEDGKTVSVTSRRQGRNILKWHTADGSLASVVEGHDDDITLTNDGRLLGSKINKGSISVWDMERDTQRYCLDTSYRVVTTLFSPNGGMFAVLLAEYHPIIYKCSLLIAKYSLVLGLVSSHFGTWTMRALLTYEDGFGAFRRTIELKMVVAICRDSKIAAVAYGGSIALWDLEELLNSSSLVKLPVFSSPKCRLTLRVNGGYDVNTSTLVDSIVNSGTVSQLAFSSTGKLVAAGVNFRLHLWDNLAVDKPISFITRKPSPWKDWKDSIGVNRLLLLGLSLNSDWFATQIAFSFDGKTIAATWSGEHFRPGDDGLEFRRILTLATYEDLRSWSPLDGKDEFYPSYNYSSALIVSDKDHFAVASDHNVSVYTQQGEFSLTSRDACPQSLSFAQNCESITVDGIEVPLGRTAPRTVNISCCDMQVLTSNRILSMNPEERYWTSWITWKGRTILRLPDDFTWALRKDS
ncbi:hypothetical protein V502_02757 [Pseudogymnoascus sp. VKM F-4520 (FW-2644)]|nr:hypothetical protein V502_02757 [Pseudogymnoascus sp. VKM F-4520 (FW-2644)]